MRRQLSLLLTAQQLHPGARLVDSRGVAEEEEYEARDASQNQHHGEQHEEGGCFECARGDGAEVGEGALAGELAVGGTVPNAVMEQPEVAGLRRIHAVPDPVGLDKNHHIYDGEAYGENSPKYANGARVPHIVVMVNLGGFLRGQHFRPPPPLHFPELPLVSSLFLCTSPTPSFPPLVAEDPLGF